ncbi:hypothetical protein ACWT_7908 [Actinoplanes sp. SE50]|uniref:hypothetical protein n=1 Tax=unclassified Actinoplanes TaxID=2626549 RepID=UPI00023EDFC9|nr:MULTISPECIES: hypothetical protein [unclassified Actinoplanes]AEV88917.1 hypothetical protein ACPL_8039 [Actinoplanes sp. SE50/110]ATO87323.1 hypothetical protein ACWT_7908 [Actinoplanes sp. SE50]SLM04741.1 hypothetical protein ACSP50_8049 [Actinoplanes sp. SE50/110]
MAGASDNGGWPPDGGWPDELPDLPEEWGVIVIPDDLSELSDEVEAVRAELHLTTAATRWQRLARRPSMRRLRRVGTLMLRAPVLIVSMAILVTVASLFASAWPGPVRQPSVQRTSGTTPAPSNTLPALELVAADGKTVPLRGRLPAVVLITDGCDCAALVAATAAAVRSDIAVLAVSSARPSAPTPTGLTTAQAPPSDGKAVRYLQDPTGALREQMGLTGQDGTAAAILVNETGTILRKFPHVVAVESIQPDLQRL